MRFYLGTHETSWLGRTDVPLFISHVRLRVRRRLPKARGPWGLDSGAFSELGQFGEWRTGLNEYVEAVERYATEIGRLIWAAPMDWMCEPFMVERTGLSIEEHQERTVQNYLDLRARSALFIPVLQGWQLADYERCVDLYEQAGHDLRSEPVVGLGSICRRQHDAEIGRIVTMLHEYGISLHGFGVKVSGLRSYAYALESADSMAWSYQARRTHPLAQCSHKSCANCLDYALIWRSQVLNITGQQSLLGVAA